MQKDTLSLFIKLSKHYKVRLFFALLMPAMAVTTTGIIAPYVLSIFIDRLQGGNISLSNSWGIILIYAGLVLVGEVILWRLALYFSWTLQIDIMRNLYVAIFNKLGREDLMFHSNRFGGSLISQSTKLIGAIERFYDMIIWQVTPMVTTIIGSVVTMAVFGLWQYAVFLIVYSMIFMVVVYIGSRFLVKINQKEANASTKNSGTLADMVTNISTVKAFGNEDYELRRASKVVKDWHDKSGKLMWGVIKATGAFSSIYVLGAIGALVFAVIGVEYKIISLGIVYLMFIYALNINRQLWEMTSITRTFNRIIGDAHEMTQILKADFKLIDHSKRKLTLNQAGVEFKNVDFIHDLGDGQQVFKDFNLRIEPGQKVGIVGHSGSGKTTLTRILLRFSDITNGKITIDGQDISQVTQQSLHKAVAFVPQEPLLFHRSLKENIAYGKNDASDKEIVDASRKAHALEFIDDLPDKFETIVGERGIKLSGGQRQRIAIARAILKDAPILVLDEATSALDSESERLIKLSLDELMKNRTTIVIAHRLSTIAKLDRIIVLEKGKIIEDGSHDELLKNNSVYAQLWSHQSGGFIEL